MTERAEQLLGTPFKIAGRDPEHGIDCCGLMFECYDHAGIDARFIDTDEAYTGTWWKTSTKQILLDPLRRILDVSLTTMLPLRAEVGTWLLYSYNGLMVAHMALYVGGGEMIHTFNERFGVVRQAVDQRYWTERAIGYATTKKGLTRG